MISIDGIKVTNLRSIADSDFIYLKPITVLVGRNSSGKSTFARVFPLLRQSASVAKRGPLLWWGSLVDYGSFSEAINRHSPDAGIGLSFRISFGEEDLRMPSRRALGRISVLRTLMPGTIEVSLCFKNGNSGTYTSDIDLSVFDFRCHVALSENGFAQEIRCGEFTWKPVGNLHCYAEQDQLIPTPSFFKAMEDETTKRVWWEGVDVLNVELQKAVRFFVHGNTAEERVRRLATRIPLGSRQSIFEHLKSVANPSSFREGLSYYGLESPRFRRLCDTFIASQLETLFAHVNATLTNFAKDIIYLEPLRATAQRYYRQQALAVREIDSKGENIAMFLDSLPYFQQAKFKEWTAKHFGIEVETKREGGHVSITIKQLAGGAVANIADMGFGFSQLLPIAAQLWAASAERSVIERTGRSTAFPLVVIEQPELHLHPDYQAKLADVFVAASVGATELNAVAPRIIAETHSAALINRLGTLVANKAIDRSAVQVILFEQDDSNSPSRLRLAEFDDEGILRNWPIGFFEPLISD